MQFSLDGKGSKNFFFNLPLPKQGFEVSFMLQRLGNVQGRCVVLTQFSWEKVLV